MLEAIKFAVPTVDKETGESKDDLWIFDKPSNEVFTLMNIINTDMSASAVIKKAAKDAEANADEQQAAHPAGTTADMDADTPGPCAKKRGRGGGGDRARAKASKKAKAKAAANKHDLRVGPEVLSVIVSSQISHCEVAVERARLWVDCVFLCVQHAFRGLSREPDSASKSRSQSAAFRLALSLAFSGEAALGGKLYKTWLPLRTEIQGLIRSLHRQLGEDAVAETPDQIAARLLEELNKPVVETIGNLEDEGLQIIRDLLVSADVTDAMKSLTQEKL